tara:strand:+ start:240 stop:488 length:249 start_codon:yes stop_codon:yes gene_type:complete
MSKTKKETINITSKTGDIFVQYLRTYRHLSPEGKQMAEDQMQQFGSNYDQYVIKKDETVEPEGRKDQDLIDQKWRKVSELGI